MKIKTPYIILLILVAIVWRITAWNYLNHMGFKGYEVDENNLVTYVDEESEAYTSGIKVGDKILNLEINDDQTLQVGQKFKVYVKQGNGSKELNLSTAQLPTAQLFITKILGVMGLLILGIGSIFYFIHKDKKASVFFLFCFVMAIHWGYSPQAPSLLVTNVLLSLYLLISIFNGSLILHLSYLYPDNEKIDKKTFLKIYSPALIGLLLFITVVFKPDFIQAFYLIEFVLVSIFSLIAYVRFFRKYFRSRKEGKPRKDLFLVLLGIVVGIIPYSILTFFIEAMDFGPYIGIQPWALLFILIPLALAIGMTIDKNVSVPKNSYG